MWPAAFCPGSRIEGRQYLHKCEDVLLRGSRAVGSGVWGSIRVEASGTDPLPPIDPPPSVLVKHGWLLVEKMFIIQAWGCP